ncbi:hypothetical protein MKX07_001758 [Trichoderma sp. CBMAI-0711]|uniref:Restriction of telomere capping protein 4 n=1 Tax=Trichoderma parareesei TaxID=858221 RepID=A0A2H2ZMM4_TRIPA|nr:hypothetical protein MKX07_001758 [Trichoderma sp. CBMAI-0711]OTA07959.1 hypothetical protein A9Z42_0089010 [Trichoderma parareesei]
MRPQPARRVGLSVRNAPQPLLKSVKNRNGSTTAIAAKATKAPEPEPKTRSRRSSLKVPDPVPSSDDDDEEDITAPPLASSDLENNDDDDDDDDDNAEHTETQAELDDLLGDSSDSDGPVTRGAIKPTIFKSQGREGGRRDRQSAGQDTNTEQESEEAQAGTRKRKRKSDSPNNKTTNKKNAFVNAPVLPSRPASHLTDDLGFTKQAKVKATFGKKSATYQANRKPRVPDEPKSKLLVPPHPLPGQSVRKSSQFIVDGSPEPSPIRPLRRLLHYPPKSRFDTADDDDTPALSFNNPKDLPDEVDDFTTNFNSKLKKKANPLLPRKKPIGGRKKKKADDDDDDEEEAEEELKSSSPPAPSFVTPAQPSDFVFTKPANNGAAANDGNLSDSSSSSSLSSLGSVFSRDSEKDTSAPCPWCGATVDSKQLADFSKGKRLNVERQQRFCTSHKQKSAIATWESNAYPQVEWGPELEARFAKHRDHLLAIINGGASHYRAALADKIELGQERTAKKQGNMIPGYYGPRGFNAMTDYLVREFSDMLMKKAARDKVIAGRGVPMFIESVLVAELGVRLIMEDMRVSPEKARRILEETKDLGGLVHPEVR